nr:MAG TPA: repressor protein [Caudoviricetes sp.]
MATFADRLKQLRQEKKLTQSELADRLKIGRSALAMYELGKRSPKYKTIDTFADFFNVSADYLRGKTSSRHGEILSSKQQKAWFNQIKETAKTEGHNIPDSIQTLPELSTFIEESKLEGIIKSQRETINKLAAMNEQLRKQQPELNSRDEREIASDLEDMMNSISSAAFEGEDDIEDIEAFKATIKAAMIQAKKIAKKKYTPKKYRRD